MRSWFWERDGIGGPCDKSVCIEAVRSSDFMVLLISSDTSAIVQEEAMEAIRVNAPCLVLAKQNGSRRKECQEFLKALANKGLFPRSFQNESELKTHLLSFLFTHMAKATRALRSGL